MAIYFADEAQTRAAHVINVTEKTDASRSVLSNVSGNTIANLWDMGTINKKVSGSIIVCTGVIQAHSANNSGHVLPLYQLHNSDYRGGWSSSYLSQNYNVSVPIAWSVVGETATGNIAVKLKYTDNNSGGGEKPFDVINPNQNDDSRMNGGVYSRAMIWEILL
tara:strand:+ start:102 stop:590 length:489 start_codon:yes stop_codon:yes gene_type:complete